MELLASGDLDKDEAHLIETGWIACAKEMKLMSGKHLKILSINLIPTWQMVTDSEKLSPELREHLNKLLCCLVKLEDDTNQLREWILEKDDPDIKILGSLALKELYISKAWRKREDQIKISFSLVSQSWNALLLQVDSQLDQINILKNFCSVIEEVLSFVVKSDSLEILSKQCMELMTKSICTHLYHQDINVSEGLNHLETVVKAGHLWPGSQQLGSDLTSLQHTWASLLSLPWLDKQEHGKFLDLRFTENKDLMMTASSKATWTDDDKTKALLLLSHLPKDVCPRWRLAVAKLAWSEKCPGVVDCLPALITNTGSTTASSLGHDVVQQVVGRGDNLELVRRLAKSSSDYICSLARRNVSKLVRTNNDVVKFSLRCQDCHGGVKEARTPKKSSAVDVDSFLKMIGHQDKEVRLSLVSLLQSVSKHSVLTPAAAELWINYVSDEDEEVRQAFAKNVQWIFRYSLQ